MSTPPRPSTPSDPADAADRPEPVQRARPAEPINAAEQPAPIPSTNPAAPVDRDELRALGLHAGLIAIAFTDASPFDEARVTIESHRRAGFDAGMQFTYRNPERSTTPTRILDDAQTLIVGAWPYATAATAPAKAGSTETSITESRRPRGDIAAFAWRDHYRDMRAALEVIADHLRGQGYTARVVADDNALVDRSAAIRAGLGWAGRNSNILLPDRGSWFVIGTVVTNAAIATDRMVADGCGSCRRCIDGCPTDAIVADGVVDARRCLAWLLQADGDFPLEFRTALGTRIYGCDDCQAVCPPSETLSGPIGDEVTGLDLLVLLSADDEALMATVGRWYIPKRDPRYVRRNALVALGNTAPDPSHGDETRRVIEAHTGTDAMLDEHARWAADRLGIEL